MPTYIRKNAWDANNGGQFTDQDGNYTQLYWYAKAVQELQNIPISQATSWWFWSAIHGEYLLKKLPKPYSYLNWVNIAYIPESANLSNPPPSQITNLFWDQCQHGSWYFPPWHRGYLVGLENLLRSVIEQLGGPSDWALPYWNYLNQSKVYPENQIPPAFLALTLPDGSSNPLYVPERYGPDGNGNIYVQVGQNMQEDANDECQWDTIYTEGDKPFQPGPGDLYGYFYGGGETGFSHSGSETGDLEQNPHNFVHGMVGGVSNTNKQNGLMGVPATAALDPVFFLHHANIDRMWTAWNVTGNNQNTDNPNWLNGPTANGHSQFAMPLDASGTPWYYTPQQVQDTMELIYNGSVYSYTYDDLSLTSYDTTPPPQLRSRLKQRSDKLNITGIKDGINMAKKKLELVGASSGSLSLKNQAVETNVRIDGDAWTPVLKSFLKTAREDSSGASLPDEVILQLEGVKGANDPGFLSVFVNKQFVKTVSLFGLQSASMEDGPQGGAGLTFRFNITNIVDELHLSNNLDINALDVEVKTKNPIADGSDITIGRIGIYRLSK